MRDSWRLLVTCWVLCCHESVGFSELTFRRNHVLSLRYRNHETDDGRFVERTPKNSPTKYFVQDTKPFASNHHEEQTTKTPHHSGLSNATNHQTLTVHSMARSALAVAAALCLYPPTIMWQDLVTGVVAAVPFIYLLPVSHQDWRLQQDALMRLYGRDESLQSVAPKMAVVALNKSIQDEVLYRLVLCGVVTSMTGSPIVAMILSSVLYSKRTSLERLVEGLWYSSLFLTGILSLPGLIVAHGLVTWHWDAVCWQHVVKQLKYVEAAATSKSDDLHRFFLAHDSRHCGKLNAHDMRRALEYVSQGKIARAELDMLHVYDEFDYKAFEAKLRDLYVNGALDR